MNPIAPGTTIGTYRLDHQLGEGGMGTVYRATDTKLNRAVAIKFVSTDLADSLSTREAMCADAIAASACDGEVNRPTMASTRCPVASH